MPSKKANLATINDPPLPHVLLHIEDLWEEWIEHRKELGKPLTIRSARMALRRLEEAGDAAAAWIEHSIACGYQGIFPPPQTASSTKSKEPSIWEISQQLEAKKNQRMDIWNEYALQYESKRATHPEAWADYQRLTKEIRPLEKQLANMRSRAS